MRLNLALFIKLTLAVCVLTFLSLICFAAKEEGTGSFVTDYTIAYLYWVFRFPTHTLFWSYISEKGAAVFLGGLLLNTLFYGFVAERVMSLRRLGRSMREKR